MFSTLGNKVVEGVEQLVDLNISAARSSLADSAAKARQLLSANSPLDVLSLATANAQPSAQKAIVYGRDLAGILSKTQSEFAKAAESQIAETSSKLIALVDELSKNAPVGSEHAIAMFKSTIDAANASYGRLNKTAKQAVETVEGNANTVVKHLSKAAEKSSSRHKK